MNKILIMPENPFFKLDMDRLCLICNCKFEEDQTPHSILDKLEQTRSQMNVYDALESISNFKEINFHKQGEKVCEFCYTNISTVIRFCEMCNKSASLLKSYLEYQVMNTISQNDITTPETYLVTPMPTVLNTKPEVLNDHEEPDIKMQVWPELPTITTGHILSSTTETTMLENEENVITNIETCLADLCTRGKMLNDEMDADVNTLNSSAAMFVKEEMIKQEITNLPEEEIPTAATLINTDKLIGNGNYEEIIDNGACRVKCKICNRLYGKYYITQHLQIHYAARPHECKLCGKMFLRSNHLKEHLSVHSDERPFACDKCGKCFSLKKHLRQHMISHLEEKKHECKVCGKKFTKPRNLNVHLSVHSDERPFPCEKCGKHFPSEKYLGQHMSSHLEEKRHECNVCGRKFTKPRNLTDHLCVHSDERPFPCEKCGKCFPSTKSLRQHIPCHLEEKRHECKVCGKKFTKHIHLRDHLIVHSDERPFACEKCGKCFPSKKYLRQHMLSHLEEKRHECKVCGKKFITSTYLKQHLSVHSDERPFACEKCGKCFPSKKHLRQHMISHIA